MHFENHIISITNLLALILINLPIYLLRKPVSKFFLKKNIYFYILIIFKDALYIKHMEVVYSKNIFLPRHSQKLVETEFHAIKPNISGFIISRFAILDAIFNFAIINLKINNPKNLQKLNFS